MLKAALLVLLCCFAAHVSGRTEHPLLWLTEHAPDQNLQMLDINDSTFRLLEAQLEGGDGQPATGHYAACRQIAAKQSACLCW